MKINLLEAVRISDYLKNGGVLSNGKVYSIMFLHKDGFFTGFYEDKREKEEYVKPMNLAEFLIEIQRYEHSEFIQLDKKI